MPRKATIVMPAEVGIQAISAELIAHWVPAFAGTTQKGEFMIENVKGAKSIHFILTILFLNLCWVVSAHSQSGNFFEGKTITLFAGSSAGGGTDIATRLIARHLERHMPGTRFMVVNKPGA